MIAHDCHEIDTTDSTANRIALVEKLELELARRRHWILDRSDPDISHSGRVREQHIAELRRIEKELQQQRRKVEAALQHARTAAASRSSVVQRAISHGSATDTPVGLGQDRGSRWPEYATFEGAVSGTAKTTGQSSTRDFEVPQFSLTAKDADRP